MLKKNEKLEVELAKNLKLQEELVNLKDDVKNLEKEKDSKIKEKLDMLFDDLFFYRQYRHISKNLTTNLDSHDGVNVKYGFRLEEDANKISFILMKKSIEGYIEHDHICTIVKYNLNYKAFDNIYRFENIKIYRSKSVNDKHINALNKILFTWDVHKSDIEDNFYKNIILNNEILEKQINREKELKDDLLDVLS